MYPLTRVHAAYSLSLYGNQLFVLGGLNKTKMYVCVCGVCLETNLASCWNSECDGLGHVKQPRALERALCSCPAAAPDSTVYFLIISYIYIINTVYINQVIIKALIRVCLLHLNYTNYLGLGTHLIYKELGDEDSRQRRSMNRSRRRKPKCF